LPNLGGDVSTLKDNGRRTGAQRLAGMVDAVRLLTWEGEEHLTWGRNARIDRASADRLRAVNEQRAAKNAGQLVARCGEGSAYRSWRC
jgi:hypothetical protein